MPLRGHDPESPSLRPQRVEQRQNPLTALELRMQGLVVLAVAVHELVDAVRVERAHLVVQRLAAD